MTVHADEPNILICETATSVHGDTDEEYVQSFLPASLAHNFKLMSIIFSRRNNHTLLIRRSIIITIAIQGSIKI